MPAWPPGWGACPPGAAAAAAAAASPQLKRQRPGDDGDEQHQQQQQLNDFCQDVQQPPARRRRLDGSGGFAGSAPPAPLPTPPLAAALAPQQGQSPLKRAGSSMSDLELDDAEADGGGPPLRQRQRTGQPEFRLVLPDPLPPSIPAALLPGGAPPCWTPPLPPGPADAFAVVPWSPPLVSSGDLQQQQERQRQEQQGRVSARCCLAELRGRWRCRVRRCYMRLSPGLLGRHSHQATWQAASFSASTATVAAWPVPLRCISLHLLPPFILRRWSS